MPIDLALAGRRAAAAHSGHAHTSWRCPECGLVPRGGPWRERMWLIDGSLNLT